MTTPLHDQNLANLAAAAGQCMTLGAVILKPSSTQPIGFTSQPTPQTDADPPVR